MENDSQSIMEKRPYKPLEWTKPTIANVIDVYGEEAEPICDYLRCRHKLSVHGLGTRGCKCKHPRNITVGAQL